MESDRILSNLERAEEFLVMVNVLIGSLLAFVNTALLKDFVRRSEHLSGVTQLLLTGIPGRGSLGINN